MKFPTVIFVSTMALLSGCCTQPRENYQQAYEQYLADGSVTLSTLHTLGDPHKTQQVVVGSLHMTLDALAYLDQKTQPTPEQKQEEIKLARAVLDYMLAHRDDFDPRLPSVQAGLRAMRKILTEPKDVRRLTELSDYFERQKP
jgi:hypothetical protein